MKIHDSIYENNGWIPVSKELPPVNTRVKLALIDILDWNLELMRWETEGWITPDGIFSKKLKLLKVYNGVNVDSRYFDSTPTHWKKL